MNNFLNKCRRRSILLAIIASHICAAASLNAGPIFLGDTLEVSTGETDLFNDESAVLAPLFDMAPVPPDAAGTAPELRDPLGLGMETGLGFFEQDVSFLDLLATPDIPAQEGALDIELPPGTLKDIDMLDDLDAFFFPYNGRAFDNRLLDLQQMELINVNGALRSTEGAPLSVGGFGKILPAQ